MPSDVETYLNHFDALFGVEPTFHPLTEKGAWPPLHMIVYRGVPGRGHFTAVSYGLSLVPHPDWTQARAELMISVKSSDLVWALAVGDIARAHRGEWAFHYGDRIRFHAELPDGGRMAGFVAFAPLVCTQEAATIQLSEYRVAAVGMIPIRPDEPAAIDARGLEWFFARPPAFYMNPRRRGRTTGG